MRISIFGLGYVGSVSAACFASLGHSVIGVDVDKFKVETINSGRSPIIKEQGLDELIRQGVAEGRLHATTDDREAVANSDLSLICVGTPSNDNGSLNLEYVRRVCEGIGRALRAKDAYHVVAFRSTMLPGSIEGELIPILEAASGKKAGAEYGVAANPEFMREGCAVADFYGPARTVIGELDQRSGEALAELYDEIEAPIVRLNLKTAEMAKYVDNAFHALKISFANEIGNLCKAEGIDSYQVMDVFSMDIRLNISAAYMKPGAAFGGSCLPKDLRALLHRAQERDLEVPVLRGILASNERQKRSAFDLVRKTGKKKIGVLGLSFKPGTDDLRESPVVELVETLIGKGYRVAIYDKGVSLSAIYGSNKTYIEKEIPHISRLMCETLDEVLERSEVLVIANRDPLYAEILPKLSAEQTVIDLVRLSRELPETAKTAMDGRYKGICW
jgi:GDP-mannose 6-dehydrogenase